jgi:prepilin-type N-terminal cleavage/methylation domain-containing protein
MAARFLRGRDAHEDGFTLIELVISASLLSVVLLAVGGILIGALKAQSTVRSIGQAVAGSQLVVRSVGSGIRNASGFKAEALDGNGQLLRARVATGTAGLAWTCRAWYYSSATGTLYTSSNSSAAVPAPAGAPAGWTLLATGVTLPSGATQPFTVSGRQLKLNAAVSADGAAHPVLLSTTFARYPQSDLTTAPAQCF